MRLNTVYRPSPGSLKTNMFRLIFLLLVINIASCHAGVLSGVACTLCLATYWGSLAYTAGAAGTMAGGAAAATSSGLSGTAAAAAGATGGAVALAAALGPCATVCSAAINPLI